MKPYTLRLLEDRLHSGGTFGPLPARNRVIYVVDGEATIDLEGRPQTLRSNATWFGAGSCSVRGGTEGARLWRWEVVEATPGDDGTASGEGVASELKLVREIVLDQAEHYLIRCDRVDFPLGGIAYTHTHRGPGTRCLLRGELTVRVNETDSLLHPGEAWFERGPDPVYAEASATRPTSFIRGMVLPRSLKGMSSIRYVKEEDREKPKTQTYTMFVDEFIDI
jgi:quercetin dioxygenase-like cupin family protein